MSAARILKQRGEGLELLENADRLWHLDQTGLTEQLSLREKNSLAAACKDILLPKGRTAFKQGTPSDALFIVNRGIVRLTTGNFQGKEKIIGFLGSGEIFGEEVLGLSENRQSEAVAHVETWLGVLESQQLDFLLQECPRLNRNLIEILNRKLAQARDEIETLSFNDTEQRIAKTLLRLAGKHGIRTVSSKALKKLRFPVSHEYLARMIGANRPHVSAIMSDFKKKGWLQYHRRRLIINIEAMMEIVETEN